MASSKLLELPREIRDMIYEQEILSSKRDSLSGPDLFNAFVRVFHPDKPEWLDDLASPTADLALMISHPQIFLEYWPMLLKHETVTVDANWLVSVLGNTPSALRLLGAHCRSLILDIRATDNEVFELAVETISRWPKLARLEFDVDPSDELDFAQSHMHLKLLPLDLCGQHAFPVLKTARIDFEKLEARHGLDKWRPITFGVFGTGLRLSLRWLHWEVKISSLNNGLMFDLELLHNWRGASCCTCDTISSR